MSSSSQPITIEAQVREHSGSRAARRLRREGQIPAVLYGDPNQPQLLQLELRRLLLIWRQPSFRHNLLTLEVGHKQYRVLVREVQVDPLTEQPRHIDFWHLAPTTKITVPVPCVFSNQERSPGLKRGGVLNIVCHTLEVQCATADLPSALLFDLEGLEIGQVVRAGHCHLPEGVRLTDTSRAVTVATIIAPSGLISRDDAARSTT